MRSHNGISHSLDPEEKSLQVVRESPDQKVARLEAWQSHPANCWIRALGQGGCWGSVKLMWLPWVLLGAGSRHGQGAQCLEQGRVWGPGGQSPRRAKPEPNTARLGLKPRSWVWNSESWDKRPSERTGTEAKWAKTLTREWSDRWIPSLRHGHGIKGRSEPHT